MNIRSLYDDRKEDDPDRPTRSFVGGERSGLAVENPDNPWANLMSTGPLPPGSQKVTIYKNGFKVNDGEFRPSDVPENAQFLEDVKAGYAPRELRENATGAVHIAIEDLRSQTFELPPPPKYELFSGEGHRLSDRKSPINSAASTVDPSRSTVSVSPDAPTTTLQFRFHDGSRATQTFNTTHTIADVHAYVIQCTLVNSSYSLLTGFPPRPLPAETKLTLAEAGLTNAAITQRLE